MKTIDKAWLLSELSKASLILTVAAGIPYSFGEVADVLGPTAKKWLTLISLSVAAMAKLTQWTIQVVMAFNPSQPAVMPPLVSAQASTQPGPLLQAGGFPQPPKPL